MEQKSTPISMFARFEVVAPDMPRKQCMSGKINSQIPRRNHVRKNIPPQMMLFPCTKRLTKKIFMAGGMQNAKVYRKAVTPV